jgi:glucokinase
MLVDGGSSEINLVRIMPGKTECGMILAGDIGGTKVNLAAFNADNLRVATENLGTYSSHEYANLQEIACRFVKDHGVKPDYACFGVAGPVKKGRAEVTNLPWVVDSQELARALNLKQVWLINDLEAYAHGIAGLVAEDFVVLNPGDSDAVGNAAVIAAGTGLGEAGLFWDGNHHLPIASEGGHAEFAPRTDLDMELLRHMRGRFGQVSWEHVLSGPGLFNIYQFLRDTGCGKEPGWLTEEFRKMDSPAAITRAALEGKCDLCVQTLELFATYYGMEAANLALKMLGIAGLYVGGGIAPKIIRKLQDGKFMKAFTGEGRMKNLLSGIPVRVIMNDKTALIGAARCAALKSGKSL